VDSRPNTVAKLFCCRIRSRCCYDFAVYWPCRFDKKFMKLFFAVILMIIALAIAAYLVIKDSEELDKPEVDNNQD